MILAAIVAVLATAVGAYLIGRHRAVRGTAAWKKGHAVGHRAGLRDRDELTARIIRMRGDNDTIANRISRMRDNVAAMNASLRPPIDSGQADGAWFDRAAAIVDEPRAGAR